MYFLKKITILAFLVLIVKIGFSQQVDTIVMYDYKTKIVSYIDPVEVDTNKIFDHTPHNFGSLGNVTDLFTELPTDSLFEGVSFTKPQPAQQFYNLTDYPVRTAVKIFGYNADTLKQVCSGMLVGESFVITAAHCAFERYKPDSLLNRPLKYDSLYIVPAFDNGVHQEELPISTVEKAFIFKSFYNDKNFDDYALLKLEKPVGSIVGYTSIAYNNDLEYYNNRIFHKFSYPSKVSTFDSTLVYNGDTMFYNYGAGLTLLNDSRSCYIEIKSKDAGGVRGQSGSTYLYTNNIDEYYNFGTATWAHNYKHYRITPKVFYQLKNIIDSYSLVSNTALQKDNSFILYPNPTRDKAVLAFYNLQNNKIHCKLFNLIGKQVFNKLSVEKDRLVIQKGDTPAGIYFIHLYRDEQLQFTAKLIFSN